MEGTWQRGLLCCQNTKEPSGAHSSPQGPPEHEKMDTNLCESHRFGMWPPGAVFRRAEQMIPRPVH